MSLPSSSVSRRALLGGALGIGVAGALTACGNNSGLSGSKSGGSGGSGSGGKVSLDQWYHQYGETGTHEAAKRYAKEYTKADVTVTWVPATSEYDTKLTSALTGGKGPDCFESHLNRALVQAGEVEPLDDLIADVKDDFNADDLAANSLDGKLYAIPMIIDPQMVYYRKSLFSAKGIQPPTSLDDWISAAKELTGDKIKGLFMGNDANTTASPLISPLIAATGGTYLTDDHKCGIVWDKFGEALVKLRQFSTDKSLLLGAPQDWTNPDALDNQLCAMQWIGMWAVPQMTQAFSDDVGCFALPGLSSSDKPTVLKGGWNAMVNAKGAHVDAAKDFTKWLWVDNAKDQTDWALSYGFHIPPRKSVADKATKLQSGVAAESVKLNNQYGFGPNPDWTPAMTTALTDASTQIIGKKADPGPALAKAKKTIENELDKAFG